MLNNLNNKDMKRIEAAKEIQAIYNCYEIRKNSLKTIYNKIYKLKNGNWHLTGYAHDYTV
jgi:hypothetical protein